MLGWSPLIGLVLALAVSGAVALLIGAITLRLGGHFLPLSTIAGARRSISFFQIFPASARTTASAASRRSGSAVCPSPPAGQCII